jgi:hypothetical protein
MKTIYIVENFCTSYEHAEMNAAILYKAQVSSKYKKIVFYSTISHFEAIKDILNGYELDKLEFYEIHTLNRKNLLYSVYKDTLLFNKVMNRMNSKDSLLVNTMSLSNIFSIKLVNIFYRKKINVIAHAIMNIFMISKKRKFEIFFKQIVVDKSIRLIVLNEVIKNNILKKMPQLKTNIDYINIPDLYEDTCIENNNITDMAKIKIGFIGVYSKEKGKDAFEEIVESISDDNIEFYHIGYAKEKINSQKIIQTSNGQMMSKEEMTNYMSKMDYFIYFLKEEDYLFRASGTFIDAVKYNKPIIALKTSFFEYFFNQLGNIGFLFENKEEMKDFLKSHKIDEKIYLFQKSNLRKAKDVLVNENLFEKVE